MLIKDLDLINLNLLCNHGSISYPSECCGVILYDAINTKCIIFPILNIQNRYILPGIDDTKGYTMDYNYIQNIIYKLIQLEQYNLSGIYHSHCDVEELVFSDMDKHNALFDNFPIFPKIGNIVIQVNKGFVCSIKNYMWCLLENNFMCVENVSF